MEQAAEKRPFYTELDEFDRHMVSQGVPLGSNAYIRARRQLLRSLDAARKCNSPNSAHPVRKLVYSIPEACTAAGVNKDTLYSAINRGELQSLKVGRRRLIRVQALEMWLKGLEDRLREENAR